MRLPFAVGQKSRRNAETLHLLFVGLPILLPASWTTRCGLVVVNRRTECVSRLEYGPGAAVSGSIQYGGADLEMISDERLTKTLLLPQKSQRKTAADSALSAF